jgi:hypothetical protein
MSSNNAWQVLKKYFALKDIWKTKGNNIRVAIHMDLKTEGKDVATKEMNQSMLK